MSPVCNNGRKAGFFDRAMASDDFRRRMLVVRRSDGRFLAPRENLSGPGVTVERSEARSVSTYPIISTILLISAQNLVLCQGLQTRRSRATAPSDFPCGAPQ